MCSMSRNVFLAACVLMDWYWMAVEDVFPKISAHVFMEDTSINLGKPSKWTATHGTLSQGALFYRKVCQNCQTTVHPWDSMCFEAFLLIIRAIGLLVKIKGEVFLCIMLRNHRTGPALGENKQQYLLLNDFHPFLFPHQLQKHQPNSGWCVVAHSIRGNWVCVCWAQLNPGKWLNLVKEELQWSSLETCSASRSIVLKIN